jgi:hypothetical protein
VYPGQRDQSRQTRPVTSNHDGYVARPQPRDVSDPARCGRPEFGVRKDSSSTASARVSSRICTESATAALFSAISARCGGLIGRHPGRGGHPSHDPSPADAERPRAAHVRVAARPRALRAAPPGAPCGASIGLLGQAGGPARTSIQARLPDA